eukprot:TRINITY_DN1152_c0_g3_i1.p1 TRINITY_DN1152_c0_g3~~TRINITY_DN1152_c0_g3_i1.p1  ORF type:complete len:236 (-),score=16.93 TRINITY_DN1152_c0_g3_i1:191-898(-)
MASHWLLVVLLLSTASFVHPYSCTYSHNGVNYDVSLLANSSSDYHYQYGSDTDFRMNVCRPTVTQVCGSTSATCEQWDPSSANGHASLGNASTATFHPARVPGEYGQGFTIQFTDGDKPPGQPKPRTMEIDFICDSSAGVGAPKYVGQVPSLHFIFHWMSSFACGIRASPTCDSETTCSACTISGCVWCMESRSCVDVPVNSTECLNGVTLPKYCGNLEKESVGKPKPIARDAEL